LPADLTRVAELSADILGACEEAGLDEIARIDLDLAVAEAVNNVIVHGYGGDDRECYGVWIGADNGTVEVVIIDHGRPIPSELLGREDAADDEAETGRGLFLIRQCVDEFSYTSQNGENRLTLRKRAVAV
jgi:serine/threonine-protein kinase RsbW